MQKSSSTIQHTPLVCHGHSRPVPHLSYSCITQGEFYIVSACLDGKAMLRHGQTGDWIGTFLGHKGAVWSAVFDPSSFFAATGSADYTCKVWDTLSGECKTTFEHKSIVKTVGFSQDGKKLLTGGQEKLIRVFDLEKPEAAPVVLEGHTKPIKTAIWQNNNTILSGAQEEGIRVFDIREGREVQNISTSGNVNSIDVTDGVLSVASGKDITFLNADTFGVLKEFSFGTDVSTVALHPTRTRFVAGLGSDFWDHVYDYHTGSEIEIHRGHHGPVHCLRYAPDGETFASGSEDGTIRLIQNEVKVYGLWQEDSAN